MTNSKVRHAIVELTADDLRFAQFLARQKVPSLPPRPPHRFSEREISGIRRAVRLVRDAVKNSFFLTDEKKDALRVLDRLKEVLPKRIRLGIAYHKMTTGARRGQPIKDARKYFLLAALVPYAKATKGRGMWRWVDQMLSEAGNAGTQGADETWRRSIKDRMVGKMIMAALPATTIKEAEVLTNVRVSTNSPHFDTLMKTGACAHLMFRMCQTRRLRQGTPISGRLSEEIDEAMDSSPIEDVEQEVLRQAALLMPGLLDPFEHEALAPSSVWGMEWVA